MPPPRGRLTIDGDEFALAALRAELPTGTTVDRWRPNDFLKRMPFVEAHITPGSGLGSARDPGRMLRHRSIVELAVETYCSDPREASDLADAVTAALYRVHRRQTQYAGGYLARLEVPLAPGEIRDRSQLAGAIHYGAAYVLHLRPAR